MSKVISIPTDFRPKPAALADLASKPPTRLKVWQGALFMRFLSWVSWQDSARSRLCGMDDFDPRRPRNPVLNLGSKEFDLLFRDGSTSGYPE